MKRPLSSEPPSALVAYELEPGKVLFVHPLPAAVKIEGLTTAEEEVLLLLLDGHDNATIARIRGTAPRTTANQVASIFKKVGVASRAELAAKIPAG
jgi:DNA-binding CsgD family transcriptional regulator